jgi:hypothetical protein
MNESKDDRRSVDQIDWTCPRYSAISNSSPFSPCLVRSGRYRSPRYLVRRGKKKRRRELNSKLCRSLRSEKPLPYFCQLGRLPVPWKFCSVAVEDTVERRFGCVNKGRGGRVVHSAARPARLPTKREFEAVRILSGNIQVASSQAVDSSCRKSMGLGEVCIKTPIASGTAARYIRPQPTGPVRRSKAGQTERLIQS